MWLIARSRQNDFRTALGSLWLNWATYFDGKQWVGPILIPHSDNLLYNTPVVLASPRGGLVILHSTDHRQDRHVVRKGAAGNVSLESDNDLDEISAYRRNFPEIVPYQPQLTDY